MVEVETRPREGKARCPYCHEDLIAHAALVECSRCGVAHHADCFHVENRGCSVTGCGSTTTREDPQRTSSSTWTRADVGLITGVTLVVFFILLKAAEPSSWMDARLTGPQRVVLLLVALVFAVGIVVFERVLARASKTHREEIPPEVLPTPGIDVTPTGLHSQNAYREMMRTIDAAAASDPVVTTPEKPRTGPLPEKCPSCAAAVDPEQDVRFCYHCGDPLD